MKRSPSFSCPLGQLHMSTHTNIRLPFSVAPNLLTLLQLSYAFLWVLRFYVACAVAGDLGPVKTVPYKLTWSPSIGSPQTAIPLKRIARHGVQPRSANAESLGVRQHSIRPDLKGRVRLRQFRP